MWRITKRIMSPRGDVKHAGYLAGNRCNIAARRNHSLSREKEEEVASRSGCALTASLIWLGCSKISWSARAAATPAHIRGCRYRVKRQPPHLSSNFGSTATWRGYSRSPIRRYTCELSRELH